MRPLHFIRQQSSVVWRYIGARAYRDRELIAVIKNQTLALCKFDSQEVYASALNLAAHNARVHKKAHPFIGMDSGAIGLSYKTLRKMEKTCNLQALYAEYEGLEAAEQYEIERVAMNANMPEEEIAEKFRAYNVMRECARLHAVFKCEFEFSRVVDAYFMCNSRENFCRILLTKQEAGDFY